MALLEVSGLTKKFGGLVAVSDLDCHVNSGEVLSVIGPNGSGKSTLFNLITGRHKPTSGNLIFNSDDITKSKPHQVARLGIGRTFQDTTIFRQCTVLDNVIIGQRLHTHSGVWGAIFRTRAVRSEENQTMERAREILAFVDLLEKENEIVENTTQEEQKRLSIAIALATDPSLLLLDEPTGGVNLQETDGLARLVEKIRDNGVTVCLIEHKMNMVMNISDRIIVLSYGKKIAEGTPQEVATNEEVITAYLGKRHVA